MSLPHGNPFRCFDRRYLIELLPAGVLLGAGVAMAGLPLPRTSGLRLAMVGAASLGVAYAIVVSVAAIRRLDELQQRVHLVAIAAAFAVTGVVAALSRFLEMAGVRHVPSGLGLWVLMQAAWLVGVAVLGRRYR